MRGGQFEIMSLVHAGWARPGGRGFPAGELAVPEPPVEMMQQPWSKVSRDVHLPPDRLYTLLHLELPYLAFLVRTNSHDWIPRSVERVVTTHLSKVGQAKNGNQHSFHYAASTLIMP